MPQPFLSDLASSIQFLSRLPVRSKSTPATPDFRKTASTFPVAGLIIALPAALILWLALLTGLPPIVGAILAFLVLALTTGGLHEDGLADVADGFFGGHTKTQKLKIMRDSRIGTYGTLALIFAIGLKSTLVAWLAQITDATTAAIVFLCVESLSRAAMLYPWSALPSARNATQNQGQENQEKHEKPAASLSARYGTPNRETCLKGIALCLPTLLLLWWTTGFWPLIAALVMMALATLALTRFSQQQIGGHTGDTLGATQQISELGLLLGLAAAM